MRTLQPPAPDLPGLLARDDTAGWDLLTWLADAGYLTTDLVALRWYQTRMGVRTASYRMAQLRTWGLVACRRISGRQVWYLTDQGARLLSDYLRTTPRELGFDGREGMIHSAFVQHALEVTRLEVTLRLHAQRTGGELTRFVREPRLPTDAGTLKPDASISYRSSDRTWCYLVEVDRNTETPAWFVATKSARYDHMAKSRVWQLIAEEIPTCLVVVTAGGSGRAARLKAAIDALPVAGGEYRRYKLVAAEDLYTMPASFRGVLPTVGTRFDQAVCLAARKPDSERRAVLK